MKTWPVQWVGGLAATRGPEEDKSMMRKGVSWHEVMPDGWYRWKQVDG